MQIKKEHLHEIELKSEKIFSGNFIQVIKDTVKLPNEQESCREYIDHPGAAAIIAITKNNEIILEYQYRQPIKQVMIEIPAGKIDNNEDELSAAKRELSEETGYTAYSWTKLGTCFPCIGYSNEKIIYYLAEDLNLGETKLDENEFVETFLLPYNEVINLISTGKITDSKTLTGIMLYQTYLSQKEL